VEKTIHIGNAVVCEYVAAGENGKTSLINVYSGDIIVSALPSSLHLGIYIELIPETDGDIDIQIEIMLGEKMLAEAHVKITGKKNEPASIVLAAMQILIEQDTMLKVIADGDGYEKRTVLAKKIFQGAIPNR